MTQNLPKRITYAGKSAAQCWPAILCYIGQQLGQGMCIYLHIQWLSLSASRMQPGILCSLLVDGQSTPRINQKQLPRFHFRDIVNLPARLFALGKGILCYVFVFVCFFYSQMALSKKASLQRETPSQARFGPLMAPNRREARLFVYGSSKEAGALRGKT